MSLQGKVAVVSGASRGIGREIALSLARAGVRVKALARGAAGLEETKGLAEGAPGVIHRFSLPVDGEYTGSRAFTRDEQIPLPADGGLALVRDIVG